MATVNPIQQTAIQSMTMPQSNQKITSGLNAANTLGLQSLGQGITKGLTSGVGYDKIPNVTTAAAQQSVTTGQRAVAKAESDINIQGRVGGAALTQMQDEAKNALGLRKLSLDNQLSSNESRLAQMNMSIKSKLIDEQLQFRRDQTGRALFTERQLMDWAVTKSKSTTEYNRFVQRANQAHAAQVALIDHCGRKVEQQLNQAMKRKILADNFETNKIIAKIQRQYNKKAQEAANGAAKNAGMWTAAGTIVGAVVGGWWTGGAGAGTGATAGAIIGGGIGTVVAGSGTKFPGA